MKYLDALTYPELSLFRACMLGLFYKHILEAFIFLSPHLEYHPRTEFKLDTSASLCVYLLYFINELWKLMFPFKPFQKYHP